MRLMSRFLGVAIVILLAFWFTAENAAEMVLIDLVLFRIRVSLPLLIFTSILGGMGLSLFVGWRAELKADRRQDLEPARLQDRQELFDAGMHEFETQDRDQTEWH